MAYLATFHWGWLAASLLLGLGTGWIAVVHRGQGVSKVTIRWLSGLAVILVAVALARAVPGRPGYWPGRLRSGTPPLAQLQQNCALASWIGVNILKERVLFAPIEFHFACKRAT